MENIIQEFELLSNEFKTFYFSFTCSTDLKLDFNVMNKYKKLDFMNCIKFDWNINDRTIIFKFFCNSKIEISNCQHIDDVISTLKYGFCQILNLDTNGENKFLSNCENVNGLDICDMKLTSFLIKNFCFDPEKSFESIIKIIDANNGAYKKWIITEGKYKTPKIKFLTCKINGNLFDVSTKCIMSMHAKSSSDVLFICGLFA